ncbi:MAG: MBL fold metallo-hydrolase [Myxococcaceae bacterium]
MARNRLKRWLLILGAVVALVAPLYYWFFVESHVPGRSYDLDLTELRKLADSVPGEKPTAVHVEEVAAFRFPKAATIAGGAWSGVDLPVYSYQVVFRSKGSVIIDTAMDELVSKAAHANSFNADSYARTTKAISGAEQIVLTHEHMDHLGGLTVQKDLAALVPKVKLNAEQLSHPELAAPAILPRDLFNKEYAPLKYERFLPIAPGVVLIRAAGHTPGSQLVFVRKADDTEVLFLGDVAWQHDNIDEIKGRPRLVSQFFLHEDADAVMRELVELNRLKRFEPNVHLVPGHDGQRVAELVEKKVLLMGFVEP